MNYRAWDEEEKKMIYPTGAEKGPPLYLITNVGCFKLDPCIEEERWILQDTFRYKTMKSTGLFDVLNREIYQNDLVEVEFHDRTKTIMIVGWNEEKAGFFFVDDEGEWRITETKIRVIGNSYMGQS